MDLLKKFFDEHVNVGNVYVTLDTANIKFEAMGHCFVVL